VILSGKCVVFIGSGLSFGYDSWPDLVNALCERCGIDCQINKDSSPDKLLDAALDAKQSDKSSYFKYLGEHFGRPVSSIQYIYDILFDLKFESYLTVNFDPHLFLKAQTAWRGKSFGFRVYPDLDRKAVTGRSIHYLHGIIEENTIPREGSIVLARDEFKEAYIPNGHLMNMLLQTLEYDHVLFIGCKLQEPNMSDVFNICKRNQQKRLQIINPDNQRTPLKFILLPKPKSTFKDEKGEIEIIRNQEEIENLNRHYNNMGIEPVWYDDENDHSNLRFALEPLTKLKLQDVKTDYGQQGDIYGR